MRRATMVMVSLALLLSLGGTGAGAVLPDITNWGGSFLLSLIQSKVNGQVTAKEISGNPLSGVVFTGSDDYRSGWQGLSQHRSP